MNLFWWKLLCRIITRGPGGGKGKKGGAAQPQAAGGDKPNQE